MEIEGIRGVYPLIPVSQRVRAWAALVRPFTLAPAIAATLIGAAIAGTYTQVAVPWVSVLVGALCVALFQGGGQALNQGCDDPRMDAMNRKEYRVCVRGLVSQQEALGGGFLLIVVALALAMTVPTPFQWFAVVLAVASVGYNCEPLRIRKYCWPAVLWLATSRGLIPVVAAWSLVAPLNSPLPWLLGSTLFIWVFGWNQSKDILDAEGDRAFGIRTVPNTHGLRASVDLMVGSAAACLLFLAVLALVGLLPPATPLLALGVCVPASLVARAALKGVSEGRVLEGSKPWQAFYVGLMGLYAVFLAGALVG